MTDAVRFRIAAAVTALFLFGVSAAGLAVHAGRHDAPAPQVAPAQPQLQAVPFELEDDD